MSRSNGERIAVRPLNPSAVASGSTRHSPVVPSISARNAGVTDELGPGDAERPKPALVADPAAPLQRARPRACRDRCARRGPTGVARPRRPATATSPRDARNSSIWVTLRSLVQPRRRPGHRRRCQGCHATAAAPTSRSWSSTRRRNASLAASHSCAPPRSGRPGRHVREVQPEVAPSVGPSRPPAPSATPDRGARTACGRPRAPAAGAPGRRRRRAGSTRRGRRSEQPRPSGRAAGTSADRRRAAGRAGRSASSSWARTAIRRASSRVSLRTFIGERRSVDRQGPCRPQSCQCRAASRPGCRLSQILPGSILRRP